MTEPGQLDYYAILGVPRGADFQAVRTAYRKIALECHPDRTSGDPVKAERFREASEAYAVLSDTKRRAEYDESLKTGGRAGLASTIFGPLFDDLVGRIREEGIHSGNVDDLIKDFFGVAKDVQTRVPEKAKQATSSPGNLLDLVEQLFDDKIERDKKHR